MSYFVEKIIKIEKSKAVRASHFAIKKDGKLRYLININQRKLSKEKIAGNLSVYSKKLKLLTILIRRFPLEVLELLNVGEFVLCEVEPIILAEINRIWSETRSDDGKKSYWNVIVGSYVEKQKVVFQCFSNSSLVDLFVKIGGENTINEMDNEISYLENPILEQAFTNPKIVYSSQINDGQWRVMATDEFKGHRVEPIMTNELYAIYSAISSQRKEYDSSGRLCCFSHGDFTPWNIKKTHNSYIVFDWEYSAIRFYGFDLIHFFWQINNKLNKKDIDQSMINAIKQAKEWDKTLREYSDEYLARAYLDELHKQFGDIL